jgi:hypothetical protein
MPFTKKCEAINTEFYNEPTLDPTQTVQLFGSWN